MRGALIVILGTLFCSCGEPQYTIPTDKDMVIHFLQNRKDFELLKQWIEEDGLEQAYPPYLSSRDSDTLYMQKLSVERRKEYDSLLLRINCKRISVVSDIITFEYFSYGGILWSIDKNFEYRRRPFCSDEHLCHDSVDLNERYKDNEGNIILYKRIVDDWYIELLYDK